MCELHIATLIAEFLANQGSLDDIDFSIFQDICPSMSEVVGEDTSYQSALFSDKGLLIKLHETVKYLSAAELYEFAVKIYQLMISLYQSTKSYVELANCYKDVASHYNLIISAVRLLLRTKLTTKTRTKTNPDFWADTTE